MNVPNWLEVTALIVLLFVLVVATVGLAVMIVSDMIEARRLRKDIDATRTRTDLVIHTAGTARSAATSRAFIDRLYLTAIGPERSATSPEVHESPSSGHSDSDDATPALRQAAETPPYTPSPHQPQPDAPPSTPAAEHSPQSGGLPSPPPSPRTRKEQR